MGAHWVCVDGRAKEARPCVIGVWWMPPRSRGGGGMAFASATRRCPADAPMHDTSEHVPLQDLRNLVVVLVSIRTTSSCVIRIGSESSVSACTGERCSVGARRCRALHGRGTAAPCPDGVRRTPAHRPDVMTTGRMTFRAMHARAFLPEPAVRSHARRSHHGWHWRWLQRLR